MIVEELIAILGFEETGQANLDKFKSGIAGAAKAVSDATLKVGKDMSAWGRSLTMGLSLPIGAAGAMTLRTAGNFESAMSRVGAATGATASQVAEMEELARELGRTTVFSAQDAADAMEMLAKNGLSTEQILRGATRASLDLAAATGTQMNSAADVATDVMLSFGKTTDEMDHVVDQISGTLLVSKYDFNDYRLALGQAGGAAGALGVEFEDMNAALVATSNLFAAGSDAGTSFKTFLQRLVPQSDDAREWMYEMNLEFFDAAGNMKNMAAIAQELAVLRAQVLTEFDETIEVTL